MNRRVPIALAVAAVAVTIQNVVYWRSTAPVPVASERMEAEPTAEPASDFVAGALDGVCTDALHAFLAALSDPGSARNAFLTRAEALAAAGTAGGAENGAVLVLEGTLVNSNRRIAWIDGITATEGASVRDHELIRIEPDSVLLQKEGNPVRLEIRKPVQEVLEP